MFIEQLPWAAEAKCLTADPDVFHLFEIYRDGEDADYRTNPRSIVIEQKIVTSSDRLAVRLAPELHHGELKNRYSGSDQNMFLIAPSRERKGRAARESMRAVSRWARASKKCSAPRPRWTRRDEATACGTGCSSTRSWAAAPPPT